MAIAQQLILHLVAEKLPEDSPNPVARKLTVARVERLLGRGPTARTSTGGVSASADEQVADRSVAVARSV
eukprot:3157254-Pleurochrysis_carterae.AAC.2